MLLPSLLRAIWTFITIGIVLLVATCILGGIFFGEDGVGRRRPALFVLIAAGPPLYAMLCWALFAYADRHDRGVQAKLRAEGLAAEATVTAVDDLGIDVGADPMLMLQLRVAPPDAEPFEAEMSVRPSRLQMSSFLPGRTLRVRFDPADRSRITVDE